MVDMRGLVTSPREHFSGFVSGFDSSHYAMFGFPFDVTSTYRLGARLAPREIRKASLNIETYSFRTGLYLEDLSICDLGDIKVTRSLAESLVKVSTLASGIFQSGKMLVGIGGEHTLTLGIADGLPSETAIVSVDAHFDLRDKYLGKKLSHTTFMRRIAEKIGPDKLLFVGVRAACKDEFQYVSQHRIRYLSSRQMLFEGWHKATKTLRDHLSSFNSIYITLDMDALDPSQAPGVANPEPEGLSTVLLLDILQGLCDDRLIGFDVVEVAPNYDKCVTTIEAAKIIFEMLCFKEALKLPARKAD